MSDLFAAMPAAIFSNADEVASAEKALMKRIAAGDESALTELVQRYGQSLAATVNRLMAGGRDCEDILQEVLMTVWQKPHQFDGHGSLEGWLKRIAVNRCRNHFRMTSMILRKLEAFAEQFGGRVSSTARAVQAKQNQDVRNQVEDALSQLAFDDRSVLVLFYLDEMTGGEIANLLNIKTDALYVRLHRAKKRLKKILEDDNQSN